MAGTSILAAAAASRPASAATEPRFAALDAALVQSMLALGVPPVGSTNLSFYRRFVIEPALPAGMIDLGQRQEPNLELMDSLRLDGIVLSPEFGGDLRRLEQITAVRPIAIYDGGSRGCLANARAAMLAMGELLRRPSAADAYDRRLEALLDRARARLAPFRGRPFCLVSFLSSSTARLYASNSLLGDAVNTLGLANAVTEPGNRWGFLDVGVDRLAGMPSAHLVHLGAIPHRMTASPLWRELSLVLAQRPLSLPELWMFGGAPSVERFVNHLIRALEDR